MPDDSHSSTRFVWLCRSVVAWLLLVTAASAATAKEPPPLPELRSPVAILRTDKLPFGREPIDYFSPRTDNAVARLDERLRNGTLKLTADARYGHLVSVLKELQVPVESQLLVYSKTSRTPDLVGPAKPRAVFFNDEVSVAWIAGARELELTATDPLKGVLFYTLPQPAPASSTSTPQFARSEQCLACHVSRSSVEVPGLLVRSWQTDSRGQPVQGYSQVTHATAYQKRWGGWFVTGAPAGFTHWGNLLSEADNEQHKTTPGFRSALTTASSFGASAPPGQHSDIVAQLVFTHQVHGLNLLIRVGMEQRLGRRSDAEAELLRYLVFADEPPLPAAIVRSKFAAVFEARSSGLRQLNLQTRLLQTRLSWLIEHRLFVELPPAARERILAALGHALVETPAPPGFEHLEDAERQRMLLWLRMSQRP